MESSVLFYPSGSDGHTRRILKAKRFHGGDVNASNCYQSKEFMLTRFRTEPLYGVASFSDTNQGWIWSRLLYCPRAKLAIYWQATLRDSEGYMAPFNESGNPAMSIPRGFHSTGLPLGLQIVGRPFDESLVLHAGHAYERLTKWYEHRSLIQIGPSIASNGWG